MTRSNIGTWTPVYRNINDMLVDKETKSIPNVIKELFYTKHCHNNRHIILNNNQCFLSFS